MSVIEQIESTVRAAFVTADVAVEGSGGHFTVCVVSPEFEGLGTLARQRKVLSALAPLMKGDHAPVHAIDKLVTALPGDAR